MGAGKGGEDGTNKSIYLGLCLVGCPPVQPGDGGAGGRPR